MLRHVLFQRLVMMVVALVLSSAWSGTAAAADKPCATPRAAVDSVFKWQRPRTYDLDKAAVCLERSGRSPASLAEAAKKLKTVYDAYGAWVVMNKISDDADFEDGEKHHVAVAHADLPDVVVEKQGNKWVWTKQSLDNIDVYYEDVGGVLKVASKLPPFFHAVLFYDIKVWQFIALLLLVVTGFVVRKLIAVVVAPRVRKLAEKVNTTWPEKIVDVVASPGATLLTAVVLRIGYPLLILPVAWSQALLTVVRVLITISIVWAAYRAVDLLAAKLADRADATDSKLDDQLVPLMRKTLKVIVFLIGAIIVLQNMRFDVTTLLASASIGGFALSFAAKDTLANLFGSISIFVDTPFQIGDWINIDGVDGTVEEVGFRSTRIRTFYNSVVVMPNATVANAKIDNFGKREFRRCHTTLGLSYDTSPTQVQAFVEGVRAIITANEFTRKDVYEVHMTAFGASSLDVMLYFFFQCDTWTVELRERHNIFLQIMRLAREIGVSFAFPTQTLHLDTVASPAVLPATPRPDREQLRATIESFGPDGEAGEKKGLLLTETAYVPEAAVTHPGDGEG